MITKKTLAKKIAACTSPQTATEVLRILEGEGILPRTPKLNPLRAEAADQKTLDLSDQVLALIGGLDVKLLPQVTDLIRKYAPSGRLSHVPIAKHDEFMAAMLALDPELKVGGTV